jgi:hypothetical protein
VTLDDLARLVATPPIDYRPELIDDGKRSPRRSMPG